MDKLLRPSRVKRVNKLHINELVPHWTQTKERHARSQPKLTTQTSYVKHAPNAVTIIREPSPRTQHYNIK